MPTEKGKLLLLDLLRLNPAPIFQPCIARRTIAKGVFIKYGRRRNWIDDICVHNDERLPSSGFTQKADALIDQLEITWITTVNVLTDPQGLPYEYTNQYKVLSNPIYLILLKKGGQDVIIYAG